MSDVTRRKNFTFVHRPCEACGADVVQALEYPEHLCIRCNVGLMPPDVRPMFEAFMREWNIADSTDPEGPLTLWKERR